MGPVVAYETRPDGALGHDPAALRRRQRGENFPVASRLLPHAIRQELIAVYALARLIDDTGDDPRQTPTERTAALRRIGAALRAVAAGEATDVPAVAAIAPMQLAGREVVAPFLDLVAANTLDQTVHRYRTYDDLVGYCRLSANPVGRLVLAVFHVDDPQLHGWSDDVCTALQILEHCQDVAEDKRDNDRVYLPLEDLARFGVAESDLDAPVACAPLRAAVAFEVDRAVALLDSGRRLVRHLRGFARLAIAGYVAGGLATVDAIRDRQFDVIASTPRPGKRATARHFVRLVVAP